MYIVNGIAFASEKPTEIEVAEIKVLDDLIMIVTFSTGEQRLFDASYLLQYPAFAELEDETIFKSAKVEYGVVVWKDGDIDIAPETMYEKSFEYIPMTA